jgi:amidohydrolase
MLLIAAKVLTEMKDDLKGNVKIIFQPNEEDAGAYKLIEEHVMENPKVDAAFGMHLWSQTPSGDIDIVDGPQMAASHYFFLKVRGKGGHAGFAHESVDPIIAASAIVQAAQSIQTREIDALNPAVIMFTEFRAGSNTTIVPEEVSMKGSIRFLYEGGEEIMERFRRIVENISAAYRVTADLSFQVGNNLLSNDPEMAQTMREAAAEVLGDESRVTTKIRTMAGEDFSDYLVDAPGSFAFVGINNPEAKTDFPHHHPKFNIDEAVLPNGVELHVRTALKLLG